MVKSDYPVYEQARLGNEIRALVTNLGKGNTTSVAYDTAWVARLAHRYPGRGFERALDWLRHNQNEDGSWGAPLLHYHDRFISTLAAIVALREANDMLRDERRVKRGEAVLWSLVSRLGRDDSDTVGFPVVSASLAEDATALGLDVPRPSIRYAAGYQKKVKALLAQSQRDWRTSALSFSFEGLWRMFCEGDEVLMDERSVATSPAATAAYLFIQPHEGALQALLRLMQPDGGVPAFDVIDVFDITWALYPLHSARAVSPQSPEVKQILDYLWNRWSPEVGLHFSALFPVPDLDITSSAFTLLRWGGYPVEGNVFQYFEMDDHFCTYRQETNPSPATHLRLLLAL